MLLINNFAVLICFLSLSSAKLTFFNLENIYGPYCNSQNIYTPDAGVVRYAGTPWVGLCELNLHSSYLPILQNKSLMNSLSVSTRFYIHVLQPPTCFSENVTLESETGEFITISCNTTEGTDLYLDTDRLKIFYYRTSKFPISTFSMVVTPMKIKTRMYTVCEFDCFTDIYCIDRSLVCDRYRNCPNGVDEAHCEYNSHRPPLSTRSKILLFTVLFMILLFDISSILICYFCCHASNVPQDNSKFRRSSADMIEEGGAAAAAAATPFLQSEMPGNNN